MKINPNIPFCTDDFIKKTLDRYSNKYVIEDKLSYATVRDYCDSWDNLNPLSQHGDLKNVQRPWALKAILSKVPINGKILEIGGGEPIIAATLAKIGYDVTIVDPYDGTGNGPTEYEKYKKKYPEVRLIRDILQPQINELLGEESTFDAIYSISVIEHIAFPEIQKLFSAMKTYLKPNGYSIHAIDHIHKGEGEKQFRGLIDELSKMSGIPANVVDSVLGKIDYDIDTYFLSAEAHNAWRMRKPYEEFPMRVMVSIQLATSSSDFHLY